ncbi:MAG: hypothetical protein P4L81_02475 [Candidatus Pacebacteria bacterium]|nr:hypothetical protein [Candidatus Paceibacterota bacterium]
MAGSDHENERKVDQAKRRSMKIAFKFIASSKFVDTAIMPFLVGVSSTIIAQKAIDYAGDRAKESRNEERDRNELVEIGRTILFEKSRRQFGVPTMNNPFGPPNEGISIPSSEAAASIVSRLHMKESELEIAPDLRTELVDGSAVLLGGPVGNGHSRHILGVRGASPLLSLIYPYEKSLLPIRFDTETPQYEGDLLNYAYGAGARPRWHLIVETKNGTYRQKAAVDGNQNQLNDYMVITSLPNIYSDNFGDRLVVVSGLHGIGTRAINILLGDLPILDRLFKKTHSIVGGWQALFEIKRIDLTTNQPIEISFNEDHVFEIDCDFGVLHEMLRNRPLGYHDQSIVVHKS